MLWENLREEEFDGAIKASSGLCILPIGCLEKHGQHLPMGTDYFEAMQIVKAATDIEAAVVFPTGPWLGEVSCYHAFKKPEKFGYRGCIALKQDTILRVLSELCEEIARNGFDKILIVNGHGGNIPILRHFLRCQSYEKRSYSTYLSSAFAFSEIDPKRLIKTVRAEPRKFSYLTDEDIEVLCRFAESGTGGAHADIRETSLIMEYDKSLVAEDKYESECGLSRGKREELIRAGIEGECFWLDDFPDAYEAFAPIGASANIGRAMKEVCTRRLVKILRLLKKESSSDTTAV